MNVLREGVFRTFRISQHGNVAIMFAMMSPVLIGLMAYSVDLSNAYYTKGRLQTSADAAALGAAMLLPDTTAALNRAIFLGGKNVPQNFGTVISSGDVEFGTYDSTTKIFSSSATNLNAVRVTAHRTTAGGNASPTFFAQIFGISTLDISAPSVAVEVGPAACFIALSSTGQSLSVSGGGKLSVPNCGIWVNSTASNAASAASYSSVVSKSTCIVGNYSGSGFSPAPKTGCAVLKDPLAAVPEPTIPNSCDTNNYSSNSTSTLSPGTYCGNVHLSGQGTTTLNPGIYYFKGGNLSIDKSAIVTGSGVVLFFDKDSSFSIASSGNINLSAPTSGTYKGISIFQSRSATNVTNKITGSSTLKIDGSIYTPNSTLSMAGSGTVTDVAKVGYVISNIFSYTGSSTFNFDSYSGNNPSALSGQPSLVR